MTKVPARIQRRNIARETIRKLFERADIVLVVHYSCESFYDRENGRTSRITSIAVRNLASGQTESFSIHKLAEQKGVLPDQISDNYDEFEKAMLDEYYKFLKDHSAHTWLHWNMRDINYGFQALEHRYKVLGGTPTVLDENKKVDLARCLRDIYGLKYIEEPRMKNLVEKNGIAGREFLSGPEEAEAFDNKGYVKLHQSTLRKVDIFADIFLRVIDRNLKTNARWTDIYGWKPEEIAEWMKEHWLCSIVAAIVTIIGTIASCVALFR